MQRYTIEEHESGYIEEKDLENFLKMQFGANRNYDIKKNDEANYVYWSYTAPRALNKDEIQIIRGVDE
ncbi:hypothetical protein DIS24_g2280 [Lasiodiplodia hormozganensis]|uniref:Uncharacterized protein n=2 Tax=Lasiodiplodia TaxID=66739 RepID=A0A5N5D7G5_9PEZI|nr:hypothetical protein DBV05_g7678 [Lasiodiplodia theobromae]KAK0661804.1 hypothetical protein DIS24_g2280 [Lasiodiplodia hormozganensis]